MKEVLYACMLVRYTLVIVLLGLAHIALHVYFLPHSCPSGVSKSLSFTFFAQKQDYVLIKNYCGLLFLFPFWVRDLCKL